MGEKLTEWHIRKWGGWQIILYNRLAPKIKPNKKLLDQVFWNMPNPSNLLLILDENGFKGTKGAAFCRKLEKYITCVSDRECFSRALWPTQPNRPRFPEWDYAVVLPRKSIEFIEKEPVYFTLLLRHELEHVTLYSSNYDTFALHAGWLFDNLKRLTYAKEKWRYSFPVEKHCYKKGKQLAITLFSKQKLANAIEKVSALESEANNLDFFNWIKILSTKETCVNLRKDFIEFCRPYKEDLRKIFDKDLEDWDKANRGKLTMREPLGIRINNFEDMFDLNYKNQ